MTCGIRPSALVCLVVLGACAGCGPRTIAPPPTVPVTGTVTMNGRPVAGVLVKFYAMFDIGKVNFTPFGETGADGSFVLSTGAGGNGAPPGEYSVTFERFRIESDPKH